MSNYFVWFPYQGYTAGIGYGHIDCGNDSSISGLTASGKQFTLDMWVKDHTEYILANSHPLVTKTNGYSLYYYWYLNNTPSTYLRATAGTADTYTQDIPWDWCDWHHIVMTGDFTAAGDKKLYLAVNGQWVSLRSQASGVGGDDSAASLMMNTYDNPTSGAEKWHGGISWVRLSNCIRFTPEASFVPPSLCDKPTADASTIELWNFTEGSGSISAAAVASANNAILHSHVAWLPLCASAETASTPATFQLGYDPASAWELGGEGDTRYDSTDGPPVASYVSVNGGGDMADLCVGKAFTLDCWVKIDCDYELGGAMLFDKGAINVVGDGQLSHMGWTIAWLKSWNSYYDNVLELSVEAPVGVQGALGYLEISDVANEWFHLAVTYDDLGDRYIYAAINGIWQSTSAKYSHGETESGPWAKGASGADSDANLNLRIGADRNATDLQFLYGSLGWIRFSNNTRFTPNTNFIPPSKCTAPSADANTIEIWDPASSGRTLVATVNSDNNGSMYDCNWDLCVDCGSPGHACPPDKVYKLQMA